MFNPGVLSSANNGGFTSIRTKVNCNIYFIQVLQETKLLNEKKRVYIMGFQNFSEPEDLSAYDGLEFRLKGDGRRYKVIIRTSPDWDALGYTIGFNTEKGKWQSVVEI